MTVKFTNHNLISICTFVGVYVENLSEFVVRSPSEVLNLLTVGKKRLVFAETKMNRNSSRFEIQLYVKVVKSN